MRNPDATTNDLMEALPGPDFPTGGVVMGKSGIRRAYETGRGSIIVRAKVDIEEQKNGKQRIIATELPYMVNKAKLIERIADLVRDKRIEGITAINDESDKDGMRVVIDVKRDASAEVILNNLYKLTLMQTSFSFNMLAIVDGAPKVLSLKEILQYYLEYQVEVITRRTKFDLRKAQARAHILEGLLVALDNIDAVIKIIRSSSTGDIAKNELINNFELDDKQAQAILDMRLVRLTGLERGKITDEHNKLLANIKDYKDILNSRDRINEIIYNELLEIQKKFGDKRRTELLVGEITSIEDEDLIEEENVVITLTHNGYIKRLPTDEFKAQNRGGRGVQGMGVNKDDFIEHLLSTATHDRLLFFTNAGKVYSMKAYEVPEYGRAAKGIPIVNLLNLGQNEKIQTVISISSKHNDQDKYLFFTTKQGTVKRTPVSDFLNIRKNGLKAIHLHDGDEVIGVSIVDNGDNMIIGTHLGYAVSFKS
uniref:DNA topoisomerase (ATP-hydrolyzing) n=1 Tax=Drosophila rhopaloa TaxID=1041015 RepID=A0A6P4FKT2_DRORH